jgi:hypothetical protein
MNQDRMRYDEYQKAGYPIASGVIEGACRHIQDRMERGGMRWTRLGAQAMLNVRSIRTSSEMAAFNRWRQNEEAKWLHPPPRFARQSQGPQGLKRCGTAVTPSRIRHDLLLKFCPIE